jgi:hypothetical protein
LVFAGSGEFAITSDRDGSVSASLRELVEERYPSVDLRVAFETASGLAEIHSDLVSGDSAMISDRPQIVVLSLVHDSERLITMGSVETALLDVRKDLVSVVGDIKSLIGAHVLVVNLSTLDPTDPVFNYHGLDEEPFSLRAHRLNSMLVSVSHETGVSVIDVDRVIAERGGDVSVVGPARYTSEGLKRIAEEIFRVLEDYGFFDERPLLEQVGAGSG